MFLLFLDCAYPVIRGIFDDLAEVLDRSLSVWVLEYDA